VTKINWSFCLFSTFKPENLLLLLPAISSSRNGIISASEENEETQGPKTTAAARTKRENQEGNLTRNLVVCLVFSVQLTVKSSSFSHSNASLWVLPNEENWPSLSRNSNWVHSPAILPPEQSAIWWGFWTVLSLWAITNVVLSFIRWSKLPGLDVH